MLTLTGPDWSKTAQAGDEVTFGRGGEGIDIALADDARLHRHCGTILVGPDWWELHNTGGWLSLRISSTDRLAVDHLKPGEALRVPWENSRVAVHLAGRSVEFEARFDPVVGSPRAVAPSEAEGPTMTPVVVDRDAGYFRALVAACEPQLTDPCSTEVATDLQIALRLNRSGREARRLTGKTVERRLDNCRARFGLKDADEFGMSSGLERRDARRRLVELALLTGTVTFEDLFLLTSQPTEDTSAGDRRGDLGLAAS